jgi:hypothetical protein
MENHISRFVGVSFQSHQLATPGDMEACNDSFQFEDLEDQICSTKSRAMLYMVALLPPLKLIEGCNYVPAGVNLQSCQPAWFGVKVEDCMGQCCIGAGAKQIAKYVY